MRLKVSNLALLVAGLLFSVLPAAAQLELDDNLSMNLSGTVSTGYAATNSNLGPSSHSLSFSGDGNFSGSYFNPQFLSFSASPFYDRSQANSDSQSITNSSGVVAIANIFSGSHFPGTISYSKLFNSSGLFTPTVPGLESNGNNSLFSVTWGATLPRLPWLRVGYSSATSESSVYGMSGSSHSSTRSFFLSSGYQFHWEDWHFSVNGDYNHTSGVFGTPEFLVGQQLSEQTTTGAGKSVQFVADHTLPMNGRFDASVSRSSYDYENSGNQTSVSNTISAAATLRPTTKLNVNASSRYNDNALTSVEPELLSAGINLSRFGKFQNLDTILGVSYSLFNRIGLFGVVTHQDQFVFGQHYGATLFNGGANYAYSHSWLGSLSFYAALNDSLTQQGNTALGGAAGVNFKKKIDGWHLDGNFRYSQNVQTLLLVYTTSSYSYGASASHKFARAIDWYSSFNGGHSGITHSAGFGSHSEGFSSGLFWRRSAVSGNYSQSLGTAVLTATGLVVTNPGVDPLLPVALLVTSNSKSYGATLSTEPIRHTLIQIGYSKARGSTLSAVTSQAFSSEAFYGKVQYRFRKLYFNAGYTWLSQSFTGGNPVAVPSYYIGLSRSFQVF